LDFGTSQLLPESQTPTRRSRGLALQLEEDDLGLDLGLEPDEHAPRTSLGEDRSIEIGRRATPRRDEPSALLDDDDLGLDLGFGDTTIGRESSACPQQPAEDDVPMLGVEEDYPIGEDIEAANAEALARADLHAAQRQRDTESPLSVISQNEERNLERTFQLDQTAMEEEDPTMVQAAQRVKRRRVLPQDAETELHNSQIKKQQEDRSAITRAPSFLPRDPLLLQLMEMQRNGGFVSNIMGDGRMQGWAPELRGILSVEIVRKAGERKRKRDSGIADVETASERQETPRLELPDEDEGFQADAGAGDFGEDATIGAGGLLSEGLQPPEDDAYAAQQGEDEEYASPGGAAFDTTEAPLLHPSQAGPVSLGTQHAAHLLRQHFAPDHPVDATEPPTPSKRTKAEALFTDLCPESTTSRQVATNTFFELLVLGTKDAVKVEQGTKELGMPIRVRGKRGLWGEWAGVGESQAQAAAEEVEVEA